MLTLLRQRAPIGISSPSHVVIRYAFIIDEEFLTHCRWSVSLDKRDMPRAAYVSNPGRPPLLAYWISRIREILYAKTISPRGDTHHLSNVQSQPGQQNHINISMHGVGNQWQASSTYSARSRFRPPFFPDEHGTRSDKVPSFVARQPFGDQRQDSSSDSLEDDVAVAGVPNANVGQCRPLHRCARGSEYEVWKRRK